MQYIHSLREYWGPQRVHSNAYLGPDHVQVFWKHKSIGNWFTRQSEAWFPIDLCFQNTYASKTLAHDPALVSSLLVHTYLVIK